jgi:two-component sensor histidine kinase
MTSDEGAIKDELDDRVSATDRGRRYARPMSVVILLALLTAAAILPPLAFSGFLLSRNNQAQQDVVATLAEATAGGAVTTIDRQLQGMLSTLRGLATSNSLQEGRLSEFYVGAQTALAGTDNYLIVLDMEMNQLINTRRPFGVQLGKTADPVSAREALESGAPVVSNGFLGQVSRKWAFNITMPFTPAGKNPVLLLLTQNAESLTSALSMENLRGGWNAVIIDTAGTVMASTMMSSDVGKQFFLDSPQVATGPVRQSVIRDGKRYEIISERSKQSGWRVMLWAEYDVIQRPMLRTYRLLLLGGAAMITVGILVAWLVGRQIAKSVQRLSREAERLGAGKSVAPGSYPVQELDTISLAMSQASAQRRAAENEIRFLMREVAHRAKNQLTVVSSLAKQSARNVTDIGEFSESFHHRLMSLARSTDLLISGSVAGVELKELVWVQIEPFRPTEVADVEISGPQFRLSPQAAQTLGLVLHEMATNAAKYGAFASREGKLSVSWDLSAEQLTLVWREHVFHTVTASDKKGFGTRLITRMMKGALLAEIDCLFHSDGIEWRFVIPAGQLRPGPHNSADQPAKPEAETGSK